MERLPRLAARRHACPKFPDNSQQGAAHHFPGALRQRYLGACLRETVPRKYITANIEMKATCSKQLVASNVRRERDLGRLVNKNGQSHPSFHQPVTAAADIQDTYSLGRIPYSAPDDAAGIPLGLGASGQWTHLATHTAQRRS